MSYPPPGPPPPPPGAPGYPGSTPGGWGGPPGGGSPGWGGPPGGGPAPAAPASKAPWLIAGGVVVVLVLLAVGALVVLAARGEDRADLTEPEMRGALLRAEEVGDDFVEDTDEDDEDDEFDEDTTDASEECIQLIKSVEERDQLEIFGSPRANAESAPSVVASFQGDDNTDVQQGITTDDGDPLDLFREVLEVCGEIGFEDGDGAGELRFGEPEQVEVGDDSLTVEITFDLTEPIPFEVSSLLVLWERDGIVSSLAVTGGVDDDLESRPPDRELLETLVEEADTKLQRVIDEDG